MKRAWIFFLFALSFSLPVYSIAESKEVVLKADIDQDGVIDSVQGVLPKSGGFINWRITLSSHGEPIRFLMKKDDFSGFYIIDFNQDNQFDFVVLRKVGAHSVARAWSFFGELLSNRKLGKIGLKALNNNALAKFEIKRDPEVGGGSGPGLAGICTQTRDIQGGEIWKTQSSDHIPSGDRRKFSTSLIFLRSKTPPSSSCLSVYDGNGNLVHQLGIYARGESLYSARFYGGSGCGDGRSASSIAALARQNTGSPSVYLDFGNLCVRIPDASQRQD